ncbi:peptidase S1 and S6, chymotrypsin/Hap [Halovivax asiaticus JCM 14624]|uniref:Peptidase S1 and S6, chymotrypsin/Hap n=1 Tax=Halovivax asiaticus JCM 14624 TaxID=1227490 RepID=M0BPI7_9EURY|nr:hypothetical protein [Halovivax asiaticus]ELZ12228.1 peptidase S1 and S6, chymotrypsin/Hap [Halovivax asiaticus JCM 14624]
MCDDENPDRLTRDEANCRIEHVGRRAFLSAGAVAFATLDWGRVGGSIRGRAQVSSSDSGPDDVLAGSTRRGSRDYEVQRVVADESGTIRFAVPNAWDDVLGTPVEGDPFLVASPDLDGYATSWEVPGIEVSVRSQSVDRPGDELDELTQYGGACEDGGRQHTRVPGYEFLTQGWFQCGSEGTTFLTMAGNPTPNAAVDAQTGPDAEPEVRSGNAANSTRGIVIGAQGVSERDLGVIAGAIHSLVTHRADDRTTMEAPRVTKSSSKGVDGRLAPGESIAAEIPPGSPGHRYVIDDVAVGDRVRVDGSRTGGQGLQGFYLFEAGERVGFPTAIDAAMVSPYGMNALTGEAGPFTLTGTVRTAESELVLMNIPGPFPEGNGPYELTIERMAR